MYLLYIKQLRLGPPKKVPEEPHSAVACLLRAKTNPQNAPLPAPTPGFVCGVARGAKNPCIVYSPQKKSPVRPTKNSKFNKLTVNGYLNSPVARTTPGTGTSTDAPSGLGAATAPRPSQLAPLPMTV